MAAIDRLYLKNYDEFTEFRIWCIRFFPKLLLKFYNPFQNYTEWDEKQKIHFGKWAEYTVENYEHYKCGEDFVKSCKQYFSETCGIDEKLFYCEAYKKERKFAEEDIQHFIDEYNEYKSIEAYPKGTSDIHLFKEMELPIANFSTYEDKLLKWFCPLDGVRKYLQKHCGVKNPYAWYYKIFWKGK